MRSDPLAHYTQPANVIWQPVSLRTGVTFRPAATWFSKRTDLKEYCQRQDRGLHKVYGHSAGHITRWLARVQRPGEKINHSLVLGGAQGIGQDTILEPVKYAVGAWNFTEVAPSQLLRRFNSFMKSVVLRVSEARDLGDAGRINFYEDMKAYAYAAAPPDARRCDEKNSREHTVMNVCGVIISTSHKTGGNYLPSDDRRVFPLRWYRPTAHPPCCSSSPTIRFTASRSPLAVLSRHRPLS